MTFDEILNKRQSIRRYKQEVPDETIVQNILESAILTASPSNTCPLRIVALKSEKIKEQLKEGMQAGYEKLLSKSEEFGNPGKIRNKIKFYWRYSKFIFNAPLLYAVGFDENNFSFSKKLYDAKITEKDIITSSAYDITLGLAIQNISLKAVEHKLASCVLTAPLSFLEKSLEELLGIDDIKIRSLLTLGYPDETPKYLSKKAVHEIYREL